MKGWIVFSPEGQKSIWIIDEIQDKEEDWCEKQFPSYQGTTKVIYSKYSKHWPYTVAYTIDCVCSKMLNHGLNHGLFLSLLKLIPCHIHSIVYVSSI